MTEKPATDVQVFEIPSRAEHAKSVRRIWVSCILIGLAVIVAIGGTVLVMVLKDFTHQLIVSCTTILFQIIIGGVFTGFTTPYFLETRVNFRVGMEMNRKALQLGTQTAENLVAMKDEIAPMMKDAKEMIATFKSRDFEKMERALDLFAREMDKGGKLDRLVIALERLADKADTSADSALGGLLEQAWGDQPPVDEPKSQV